MTYLPIIMLTLSTIPSQIPHIPFNILSLGDDAVERHAWDETQQKH